MQVFYMSEHHIIRSVNNGQATMVTSHNTRARYNIEMEVHREVHEERLRISRKE